MTATRKDINLLRFVFADDGLIPNNKLPMLFYRQAIKIGAEHPQKTIEGLFGSHHWGEMWRNGIYTYLHYHSTVHEAMGVAQGSARVRFGGDGGKELEISKGDAVVLPAGTGHQCLWASDDFVVVGAYPPGSEMEISMPTVKNHRHALTTIPKVACPKTDPLYGEFGPLTELWSSS
jgi:uncharacterized protein YjlB